jgi:hypothetical protein
MQLIVKDLLPLYTIYLIITKKKKFGFLTY